MNNWIIDKLSKNTYMIKDNNGNFIKIKVESSISGNPEILFDKSCDMSEDGVIFFPCTYPTDKYDNTYTIIGNAYKYENNKCTERSLVDAVILDTNIPAAAKERIELCLL